MNYYIRENWFLNERGQRDPYPWHVFCYKGNRFVGGFASEADAQRYISKVMQVANYLAFAPVRPAPVLPSGPR